MWYAAGTTSEGALSPSNRPQRRLEDGPIVVGVCAMDKKAKSQPMTEMLTRLTSFTSHGLPEFTTVFFPETTILNEPVEQWPLCEGAHLCSSAPQRAVGPILQ